MKIKYLYLGVIVPAVLLMTACSTNPKEGEATESCGQVANTVLADFGSSRVGPGDAQTFNNVLTNYSSAQSWQSVCGATLVASPSTAFWNEDVNNYCRKLSLKVDERTGNLVACLSDHGKWKVVSSDLKKVKASHADSKTSTEVVKKSSQSTVNSLPAGNVTINGIATVGQTLIANSTLSDANGMGDLKYQWKAHDTVISGATGTTYKLTKNDIGKAITVTVSYTDLKGNAEKVCSTPTAVVTDVVVQKNPVPTAPVKDAVAKETSATQPVSKAKDVAGAKDSSPAQPVSKAKDVVAPQPANNSLH